MNDLVQLQKDVKAMLLACPELAAAPINTFREKVVESINDEAASIWTARMDGKVGTSILVLMPELLGRTPNVPGPQGMVEIVIRIFEDPTLNNTGMSAEDLGFAVLKWLEGLIIEGLTVLYVPDRAPALQPNNDYEGFIVYDVRFHGELPQDSTARTADVVMADNGAGEVTLTCADPASAIYYATGDNSVQPGETAQLYLAPFTVPDRTIVRAVAWNQGLRPSHVNKGTINYD